MMLAGLYASDAGHLDCNPLYLHCCKRCLQAWQREVAILQEALKQARQRLCLLFIIRLEHAYIHDAIHNGQRCAAYGRIPPQQA